MSRFQAEQGHDVSVLTMDIGIESGVPAGLAPVRFVILKRLNKRFLMPRFSWKALRTLVASSDIIHLMSHWTLLNGLDLRWLRPGAAVRESWCTGHHARITCQPTA